MERQEGPALKLQTAMKVNGFPTVKTKHSPRGQKRQLDKPVTARSRTLDKNLDLSGLIQLFFFFLIIYMFISRQSSISAGECHRPLGCLIT